MINLLRHCDRSTACVIVEQGMGLHHKIAAPWEHTKEETSAREKAEHGMTTPP